MSRQPIGHVEATVRFSIYEGDAIDPEGTFPWFEYAEPRITKGGNIVTVRRECSVMGKAKVVLIEVPKS